jgi:hypothetical protein
VDGGPPRWGLRRDATIALIKYRMRLEFYKHVYDAKKDRRDLESAGKVTHPRSHAIADADARRRTLKTTAAESHPELRSLPAPPSDETPTDTPSGPPSAA